MTTIDECEYEERGRALLREMDVPMVEPHLTRAMKAVRRLDEEKDSK